jgi:DNA gyrase subunit A
MEIIQGPDFPTGWTIYDPGNIKEVYKRGKWGIVMRGKTHVEQQKNWDIIVIDEIPYVVNKSTLLLKLVNSLLIKKLNEWLILEMNQVKIKSELLSILKMVSTQLKFLLNYIDLLNYKATLISTT